MTDYYTHQRDCNRPSAAMLAAQESLSIADVLCRGSEHAAGKHERGVAEGYTAKCSSW